MGNKPGLLLVISGPSGAGKSTVLRALMRQRDDIRFSVSATTRAPRIGEIEGVHYCFMNAERFARLREDGELLECAEYAGYQYGTPLRPVREAMDRGAVAVLDIEARGAMQVREKIPDCVTVFLSPSNLREAERRLRSRNTEDEARIRRRMDAAAEQLGYLPRYDYYVRNDSLDAAVDRLHSIIEAERCRVTRLSPSDYPAGSDNSMDI